MKFEEKMERVRAQIVGQFVFFAVLLARLPTIAATHVPDIGPGGRPVRRPLPTGCTDGKRIWINPAFFEGKAVTEMIWTYLHDVLHVILKHPLRRGSREPGTWNEACDYKVVQVLVGVFRQMNLPVPDRALAFINPAYDDMTVEAVYEDLIQKAQQPQNAPQNAQKGPQGAPSAGQGADSGEGQDNPADEGQQGQTGPQEEGGDEGEGDEGNGGGDQPTEGEDAEEGDPIEDPGGMGGVIDMKGDDGWEKATEAEQKSAEQEMEGAVAAAVAIAKARGKLPAGMEDLFQDILSPTVDWRAYMLNWLSERAMLDFDWQKADQQYLKRGFYAPSISKPEPSGFAVVGDSSGSMSLEFDIAEVLGETVGVLNEFNVTINFWWCDSEAHGPIEIGPEDIPFDQGRMKVKGRGGTSFAPAFEAVAEFGETPTGMIYITDGFCDEFPAEPPEYPVLWVLTSKGKSEKQFHPPFGEVVKINR